MPLGNPINPIIRRALEDKRKVLGREKTPDPYSSRESEAKKEVYLTLQQQLELARIEEVRQSPILHILDNAVTPIRKSSPNRLVFLAISAFFGVFTSSLIALFKY